tara:strand:+ start:4753 stop:6330 length:1578 start_codon:yes stop_codon:yes gene_type:complete
MKVLIADTIHSAGIEMLKEHYNVIVKTNMSPDELLDVVPDCDAILVRSKTKITRSVIEKSNNLKVVGRAGVGVDNIDLKAATDRGILVVNAPEASSITVAEHTFGLIMALARNIPFADSSLKSGKWEKKKFIGMELRGKTIGIIGLGRIGTHVSMKAKAFGMKIIAYDPYITKERCKDLGIKLGNFNEVIKVADFITVHVPFSDKTKGLIAKKEIDKMKEGVFLINCARGGIISEDAIVDGLESGKLAGVALDVFEVEPPLGSPLLKMKNVIVTPHLGASTEEAQRHASTIACEEVLKVLDNQAPMNVVNMPVFAPDVLENIRGYLPLTAVMGRFISQLIKGRMNEVAITFCGNLMDVNDLKALSNSTLTWLLSNVISDSINILNASIVAKNRGVRVIHSRQYDTGNYGNLIILKVKTDNSEIELKGSLLGEDEPRIVEVDGYSLNLLPKGKILMVKHEDRPGMIGKVTLSLGNNNINIASMQVGRKKKGGFQLMVIRVDQKIPEKVINLIKKINGVVDTLSVDL